MRLPSALLLSAALAFPALAQERAPVAAPPTPPIAAPRDEPYPAGALKLAVDATDVEHRIYRIRETVPVTGPGPLILLYPEWIPGGHDPEGPIAQVAGLVVSAGGRRIAWRRDPVTVAAFHLDVPAGVTSLDVEFQYLTPLSGAQGRRVMTPEMLSLQWISAALYPAGWWTRRIPVDASVRLPAGWSHASALEVQGKTGDVVTFKRTTFETLADSPLIAGKHMKTWDLGAPGPAPVRLNVIADRPEQLAATSEQIAKHKALVQQAYKLYGSHHYGHYDFLFTLSDKLGGIGLEHHQSSEDGVGPDYFLKWDDAVGDRDLLPHEYTHSWNGKFRRPADLWTPDFHTPMRDSLLWVYEGQTQYWGHVLAARSGLWSRQEFLDAFATTAATYDTQPGRAWSDLQDTTNGEILGRRGSQPWSSWQRSLDYYSEGALIWLDADTLIRERSGGRRSLDDFARRFFGVEEGAFTPLTYTFEDLVAALNAVEPYDWRKFLRDRLDGHGPGAPLGGIRRGGYRLVYDEVRSDFIKKTEADRKINDLTFSLGLVIGESGNIGSVLWEGPAFKAGLSQGWQVLAVDGTAYSADGLRDTVKAGKGKRGGVDLLVKQGDTYKTVHIAYDGGLRYPHLVKDGAGAATLDAIATARR